MTTINKTIDDVAAIPCPGPPSGPACGLTGIENIDLVAYICTTCGSPRIPIDPDEPVMLKRKDYME